MPSKTNAILVCALANAMVLASCNKRAFHAESLAQTVYGSDDRFQPWDTAVPPLLRDKSVSAIAIARKNQIRHENGRWELDTEPLGELFRLCPGERFFEEPLGAFCSAFLVAPDRVLTAGHCMEKSRDCERSVFLLDYVQPPPESGTRISFGENQVVGCKRILESGTDGLDFALVQLSAPVTDRAPLTLEPEFRPEPEIPLAAIGFPSGLPEKIILGKVRRPQTGFDENLYLANLDTATGSSGSAVLDARSGHVTGILVGGDEDFVTTESGCKMAKRCEDDGCRGEKILKASVLMRYLR